MNNDKQGMKLMKSSENIMFLKFVLIMLILANIKDTELISCDYKRYKYTLKTEPYTKKSVLVAIKFDSSVHLFAPRIQREVEIISS